MSGLIRVDKRSARGDRLGALAPRVAIFGALGVLSLAGVRAILEPTLVAPAIHRESPSIDQGAQAFAEGFARAYLAYDPNQPERRERYLASYLSDELDPDAGLSPSAGSRAVSWTAIEGGSKRGGRHTVTVAAQTNAGLVHLAVPVARDERGFLQVSSYPALVGPPAASTANEGPAEEEVEDAGLSAVAERAIRNYLGGDKRDLLADLAPEAVVSLPSERLELRTVHEITWARPGRTAAVLAEAVDELGNHWTLRYELEVHKRDRWYVRSLHVDPRHRGGPR